MGTATGGWESDCAKPVQTVSQGRSSAVFGVWRQRTSGRARSRSLRRHARTFGNQVEPRAPWGTGTGAYNNVCAKPTTLTTTLSAFCIALVIMWMAGLHRIEVQPCILPLDTPCSEEATVGGPVGLMRPAIPNHALCAHERRGRMPQYDEFRRAGTWYRSSVCMK